MKAERPEEFNGTMETHKDDQGLPGYLGDLARLELAAASVKERKKEIRRDVDRLDLNPTLIVLDLSWKNLIPLFVSGGNGKGQEPEPGRELVLVWLDPETLDVRTEVASDESLLALKKVVEGLDSKALARIGNTTAAAIDATIDRVAKKGILISPPSKIRRDADFPRGEGIKEEFFSAPVFTLQWHITQACDLHCKHCYDRSDRSPLTLEQGYRVLDDLYDFCRSRNVSGQVSFSGGNPFLFPRFFELYGAASERGFALAVLGNPVSRRKIEDLLGIEKPVFFQVSLEGLETHNDNIRGPGHFERTMEFLYLLREFGIYSMVMLTLTKDNMDQVLPLTERLRGLTDLFTFNRLAMFGEGAALRLPSQKEYIDFLSRYQEAAESNPIIGLKDNLFNILRSRKGVELFGGCAGHGCGAAFNFLSLLPDGEVHACRKLPSLLGNIYDRSFAEIYDSEAAGLYRKGCEACIPCPIRPVCGGCLAVASGHGLDPFRERDPYCFFDYASFSRSRQGGGRPLPG